MATDYDKLNRMIRNMPKVFKAESNLVINALLQGFALADTEIAAQLDNTKAQLFIATAANQNLNRLATSLGVSRPTDLGMSDDDFRNLVPNLSLKHKQIRKTFYDTMDVFWGPLFSRANVTTTNSETFNISPGDIFSFSVDSETTINLKVLTTDLVTPGAMTAAEAIVFFNKIDRITATIYTDPVTSNNFINIRTNTPGLVGSLEIFSSTAVGVGKFEFTVKKYELWQLAMRSVIYEIRPNEMVIEIPAVVPSLRRTLRGSHHWHTDSTLETPVAPENGTWQGSFIYDPNGITNSYNVSQQRAKIQEILTKGNIYTKVTVDDTSGFLSEQGELIFGWGTETEELPVRYRGVPNSNTVLLDPSYVFQNTQAIDTYINVLVEEKPVIPSKIGTDLPIFLTSPSSARLVVQEILAKLAAAGIILNFVILAPEYKYLLDNPYITTDDSASI